MVMQSLDSLERMTQQDFAWLGMVSGIWLQTGSDLKKLEKGIKHLRKASEAHPVPIYGSFFLPSKK